MTTTESSRYQQYLIREWSPGLRAIAHVNAEEYFKITGRRIIESEDKSQIPDGNTAAAVCWGKWQLANRLYRTIEKMR